MRTCWVLRLAFGGSDVGEPCCVAGIERLDCLEMGSSISRIDVVSCASRMVTALAGLKSPDVQAAPLSFPRMGGHLV
jgi:hypothetical protein